MFQQATRSNRATITRGGKTGTTECTESSGTNRRSSTITLTDTSQQRRKLKDRKTDEQKRHRQADKEKDAYGYLSTTT